MFIHYLPAGMPIDRLTRAGFQAHEDGLSLADARDRLMMMDGLPEACDSQTNVPFTFLGILYGNNDLEETMLATLHCGYDTDCTMATAGALLGQIMGAKRIPQRLIDAVGDELVMAIEYRREDMTLNALARDTARMGVLLSEEMNTGVQITDAPAVSPLPDTARRPATQLAVTYDGLPAAALGNVPHNGAHPGRYPWRRRTQHSSAGRLGGHPFPCACGSAASGGSVCASGACSARGMARAGQSVCGAVGGGGASRVHLWCSRDRSVAIPRRTTTSCRMKRMPSSSSGTLTIRLRFAGP